MSSNNKKGSKGSAPMLTKAGTKIADAAEKGIRAGAIAVLDLVEGTLQAILAPPRKKGK